MLKYDECLYIAYSNYDERTSQIITPNGFKVGDDCNLFDDSIPNAYYDTFCSYGRTDLNVKCVSINSIPKNAKYIYPISLSAGPKFSNVFDTDVMMLSDNIVDDIKSKRCTLLFDFSMEGFSSIEHRLTNSFIIGLCKKHNIPINSVHLMDGNLLKNRNVKYNHFGIVVWNRGNYPISDESFYNIVTNIAEKNERSFKICCLNRRGKDFRSYVCYSLYDIYKNSDAVVTMSEEAKKSYLQYDKFKYKKNVDSSIYKDFVNSIPWTYDIEDTLNVNPTYINERLHTNTYIQVVTETWFVGDTIFFSEKTFKPIIMMQPFILVSTPGSLARLRSLGYETFPEIFDESYDGIEDPVDRLDFIVKEIKKVYSYSKKELSNKLYEVLPKLVHNATVHKNSLDDPYSLYDILKKEIYDV